MDDFSNSEIQIWHWLPFGLWFCIVMAICNSGHAQIQRLNDPFQNLIDEIKWFFGNINSKIRYKIISFLISFKKERLTEIIQAVSCHIFIVLIPYINLLNPFWIINCLFLRNMEPLRLNLFFIVARPCQALRPVRNGSVSPASCTTGPSQPGSNCTVSCSNGYRFVGNPLLICYGNGQWSNYGRPMFCMGR